MTGRSRFWWIAAAIFTLINVAGIAWALVNREPAHAALHVVLLVGGFVMWRLAPWAWRRELPRAPQADERVEYLQQSVDAMALEVERIGEAQRYSDKLRVARSESPDGAR